MSMHSFKSIAGEGRLPAARPPGGGGRSRDGSSRYAELLYGADRLATRLARFGVDRGDRVGLWITKSLEAVTAVHGILRTGASYVPVDPTGPAPRAVGILAASSVKAIVVAAELVPAFRAAWTERRAVAATDRGRGTDGLANGSGNPRPSAGHRGLNDTPWDEVIADRAPSPLANAARGRRPGLYPFYLGLDRPTQGRDALARQCVHVPGLVRRRPGPLGRRRPFCLACPVSL